MKAIWIRALPLPIPNGLLTFLYVAIASFDVDKTLSQLRYVRKLDMSAIGTEVLLIQMIIYVNKLKN